MVSSKKKNRFASERKFSTKISHIFALRSISKNAEFVAFFAKFRFLLFCEIRNAKISRKKHFGKNTKEKLLI